MAAATRGSGFGISWHTIITPYEEEWRMYSKMVEVRDPRYFGSGIINGLNGFAMANGVKTNLFEAAVRYNYSDFRRWHQFRSLDKTSRVMRLNEVLGKEGRLYLKGFTYLGYGVSGLSALFETCDYVSFSANNGIQWDVTTKFGFDMAMLFMGTFGGPLGFVISTTYFVIDVSTDGFGGFGKMY